jgi:hypothetical protein
MIDFRETQKQKQIAWWKNYTSQPNWESETEKWGKYKNEGYPHITKADWSQLLWKGIANELPTYLGTHIKAHSGVKNLLSSWVAAANLYFPARSNQCFEDLLLGFLQTKVSTDIIDVDKVELEFSLEGDSSPKKLLGEMNGSNGVGQTSPDVAFIVKTKQGTGLILTECKYTEHSFYGCPARRTTDRGDKSGNPHPEKCLESAALCDFEAIPCHQKVWGRKYLDNFKLSNEGKNVLKSCPAATAGYQLLRQQALANGIKESGKYDLVVSAVSFDGRNNKLIGCLKKTGIPDFQTGWNSIYQHGAEFITWHHQDWVKYVRNHNKNDEKVNGWLKYLEDRYGY